MGNVTIDKKALSAFLNFISGVASIGSYFLRAFLAVELYAQWVEFFKASELGFLFESYPPEISYWFGFMVVIFAGLVVGTVSSADHSSKVAAIDLTYEQEQYTKVLSILVSVLSPPMIYLLSSFWLWAV